MRIAIIGGGINGYCCAVQILEHFKNSCAQKIEVTIISEEFSPNTTGDGSAGLWGPYLLGDTSKDKIYKWAESMHNFLEKIWLSPDCGEARVCLIPVIRVTSSSEPYDEFWKDIVYNAIPLTQTQLDDLSALQKKNFTYGLQFVTYTAEPMKLLPYLMKRFESNGGKTIRNKVNNLSDFYDNGKYDVIINCTGLGSRNLIYDQNMHPIRGQVSRVKANWMYYVFIDDSDGGYYIIPNSESVVLGGTHQVDDYNLHVSSSDKKSIVEACYSIVPGLSNSTHLFDWVGLRPGRNDVRVETEKIGGKLVIHNYGHGGAGVTLAWGCAEDVLQMLKTELVHMQKTTKSKL